RTQHGPPGPESGRAVGYDAGQAGMTLSDTVAETSSCRRTDTEWAPRVLIGLPRAIARRSTSSPATAARAPAISEVVTAPNRRPAEPALTFTSTGPASSLLLRASACSWSRTARVERAFLIDSTVFSPPRVHLIATPRGRR